MMGTTRMFLRCRVCGLFETTNWNGSMSICRKEAEDAGWEVDHDNGDVCPKCSKMVEDTVHSALNQRDE